MAQARRMTRRTTAAPTGVVYETEPQSIEDVKLLSEDGILAHWSAVCRVLENDIHSEADDEPGTVQPTEPPRQVQTGQQMLDPTPGSEFAPLTLADAKRMTVEQYEARRSEIDALAGRGAA